MSHQTLFQGKKKSRICVVRKAQKEVMPCLGLAWHNSLKGRIESFICSRKFYKTEQVSPHVNYGYSYTYPVSKGTHSASLSSPSLTFYLRCPNPWKDSVLPDLVVVQTSRWLLVTRSQASAHQVAGCARTLPFRRPQCLFPADSQF